MNSFKQISIVTGMNFRALRNRWGTSLVIVMGMAAVVGVMLSVMSLSTGMLKLADSSSNPKRAIVLNKSSQSEGTSVHTRAVTQAILDTPGIKRNSEGKPISSSDVIGGGISAVRKADGLDASVAVRGIGPGFFALRPEVKLVEGRIFQPGLNEVIIGAGVRDQYQGFDVGSEVRMQGGMWKIVGVFETDAVWNSIIMTDNETLMAAIARTMFSSITVELESPDGLEAFRTALNTNPQVIVDVISEPAYYDRQFTGQADFFRAIAFVVGGVMSLGAVFGAINTMYAAVSKRRREIATLRAIGFGASPVVISVVAEAVGLAVLGALIGALLAWLVFNGSSSFVMFQQLKMFITGQMFVIGIGFAIAVGLVGALFPAIRAGRQSVATALQVR